MRTGTGIVLGVVLSGDTGQPVEAASVELRLATDSTVVTQVPTNETGQFRIANVREGEYLLRIMSLGYGTVFTQAFEVAEAETRNLGELRLSVSALMLDAIAVSAERSAVTFEADRTSYAVGVMPGTQGTTATETLQQVPDLEVDIDGRITLRGSTPTIYINGRPAPMDGEALTVFLEQFPADYLSKIEVMDNPSARFGAAGSGGIVNLVLKEDVELGLSGSAFVNGGTRGQYSGGGRGTMQRGAWTYSGGGFVRLSDVERTSFDLRQNLVAAPAFLRQESNSDRSGLAGNVDMDIRYEPTERTRFFFEGRVNASSNDATGFSTTTHLDEAESPILAYGRMSDSEGRNLGGNAQFGFDYTWEPRRHEFEFEVGFNAGRQTGDSRQQVTEGDGIDGAFLVPAALTVEDEDENDKGASLNVDYTRPLGEVGRMELGVETEWTDRGSDLLYFQYEDPNGAGVVTDRGYNHREFATSLYGTASREFGKFGLQGGLRAEHVVLDLDVAAADAFRREYTNVFPSLNASWRFDNSKQVRVSYSRRIGRPGVNVLNPVNRSDDPLYRRVGNPDVTPQFTHSVSMDASWSGSAGNLRLSPYYRTTTNEWVEITSVDELGVSTRTYQNLASQESYGASLSYSIRQRGGVGGHISISGQRNIRDASNLAARYSASYFRWSSRANVNTRITDALSADGNFSYTPPVDLPQGRSDARYTSDFGVRYRFADNRASLRLSLRDPFELREQNSRTSDNTWIQIGRTRESTRSLDLSLSYSLGGGAWRGGPGGMHGR